MSQLPFMSEAARREFAPGEVREITPLLRRITGPNAGIMTGPGTNCYLVGHERIAAIDPGIADDTHIERIAEIGGDRIEWIIVTHAHPDHAPGSRRLSQLTGAPVLAFPHQLTGIRDQDFQADDFLRDGDVVETGEFTLRAIHTPGHAADHLCFVLEQERILLAGDQVMDGATVVIAPPDGDMRDYLESLERLKALDLEAIAPAHGRLLRPPREVLQQIIDHRLQREAMVVQTLADAGAQSIPGIVAHIYSDVPQILHRVAEGSVHAHLLKLEQDGLVAHRRGQWRLLERAPGEAS